MALFDPRRTNTFTLNMFAYALFLASLFSPAVESTQLNGTVSPVPGWLCLIGSFFAFIGGILNTIQFDSFVERLSMVSYLPCNICVLLHSLAMIRWLRALRYVLFPILLFGSGASLILLIHSSGNGIVVNVLIGYYLWVGSIWIALASTVMMLCNRKDARTKNCSEALDRPF